MTVIKRHYAAYMVRDRNRKGKCAVEPNPFGNVRAREIGIRHNVINPHGLTALQDPPDEVDAGKQNRFTAGLFEFFNFISGNVPAALNVKGVRVGVDAPKLPKFKAHSLAHILQQLRSGYRET